MNSRRKRLKFKLKEIPAFDARRGYKRCSTPGVVVQESKCEHAPWIRPMQLVADLWRDQRGQVVIRFHCHNSDSFHFEASLATGKPVLEEHMEEFSHYISDVLCDWDGEDDAPDPDFDYAIT